MCVAQSPKGAVAALTALLGAARVQRCTPTPSRAMYSCAVSEDSAKPVMFWEAPLASSTVASVLHTGVAVVALGSPGVHARILLVALALSRSARYSCAFTTWQAALASLAVQAPPEFAAAASTRATSPPDMPRCVHNSPALSSEVR